MLRAQTFGALAKDKVDIREGADLGGEWFYRIHREQSHTQWPSVHAVIPLSPLSKSEKLLGKRNEVRAPTSVGTVPSSSGHTSHKFATTILVLFRVGCLPWRELDAKDTLPLMGESIPISVGSGPDEAPQSFRVVANDHKLMRRGTSE